VARERAKGLDYGVGFVLAIALACALPASAQDLLNGRGARQAGQSGDSTVAAGVLRSGNFDPDAAAPATGLPEDDDLLEAEPSDDLRDGLFATDEGAGQATQDGADPVSADQRPQTERSQFSYPADPVPLDDGDNPLLFQVEEIEPFDSLQNRRPSRLASLDPYDPVGIRFGSFIFFPEVEIATVHMSNVFTEPDGHSDVAGELRPSLRLVSNWSNHALEFQAAGDLSNYRKFGTDNNDRGYTVESRGRLDVTRRTNLQGSVRRQRSQESRSSIDATSTGPRSTVVTNETAAALNQRFNRLSVQLRGAVSVQNYSATDTADPLTGLRNGSVRDRDVTERRAAVRASWEIKPSLSVFAEAEGNERSFEAASTADNRRRDSQGARFRAGASFGQTSEILQGEISLGHGIQDLDDRRLADASGFLVDANLAWRINSMTSLFITASSDISSVTQTTNSGLAIENRAGAELRHAFRPHFIGSTGLEYTRRDYAGIDVEESQLIASVGLEYYISREAVAFGRYEHTKFRSDFQGSDYDNDEVRVGLRLRR